MRGKDGSMLRLLKVWKGGEEDCFEEDRSKGRSAEEEEYANTREAHKYLIYRVRWEGGERKEEGGRRTTRGRMRGKDGSMLRLLKVWKGGEEDCFEEDRSRGQRNGHARRKDTHECIHDHDDTMTRTTTLMLD